MGQGLVDDADVTLTTDYATAKDVFVSGNQQAGMQAFMAGKVKVQGDMTKLMAGQQGGGQRGSHRPPSRASPSNDRRPADHGSLRTNRALVVRWVVAPSSSRLGDRVRARVRP